MRALPKIYIQRFFDGPLTSQPPNLRPSLLNSRVHPSLGEQLSLKSLMRGGCVVSGSPARVIFELTGLPFTSGVVCRSDGFATVLEEEGKKLDLQARRKIDLRMSHNIERIYTRVCS